MLYAPPRRTGWPPAAPRRIHPPVPPPVLLRQWRPPRSRGSAAAPSEWKCPLSPLAAPAASLCGKKRLYRHTQHLGNPCRQLHGYPPLSQLVPAHGRRRQAYLRSQLPQLHPFLPSKLPDPLSNAHVLTPLSVRPCPLPCRCGMMSSKGGIFMRKRYLIPIFACILLLSCCTVALAHTALRCL